MCKRSLVEIKNLKMYFPVKSGLFSTQYLHALDDITLNLETRGSIGLVGESGSGKSTVARLIMRLMEPTGGEIFFDGEDIFKMNMKRLREVRKDMSMIFQDPSSALDPRMTVEDLIGEPSKLRNLKKREIGERVKKSLELVNLPSSYARRNPHQLSGGEKQRVGIARALSTDPRLVIADEPTSALDVSIQAQILELIKDLIQKLGVTLLFISHDLAVVKYVCEKAAVMYNGRILELGPTRDVLRKPLHPYTQVLYSAVPEPDLTRKERIFLKTSPYSFKDQLQGCKFSSRCPVARENCRSEMPELVEAKPGHFVACNVL